MTDIVEYKYDPSKGVIVSGDVVCLPAAVTGTVQIVKATPDTLAAGGTVVGIAVGSPDANNIVKVNVSGFVSNSITNLNTGSAGAVYSSSFARCTRIAANTDYLVGACDNQGNVKVQPIGALSSHNIASTLNVRAFGAVGDGITDDLPAFNAAIAAAPKDEIPDNPGHAFTRSVWIPKGKYRLSDNLIINQSIELFGDGQGFDGNGASELLFDSGKGIINIVYCAIRKLRIQSTPVEGLSVRENNHQYNIGEVVRPRNDNRWYFTCIRAGTSGPTEPESWRKPNLPPDTPLSTQIPSDTTLWQPNTKFSTGPLGSVVRRQGDFDRIFLCLQSGQSGGSEPNWNLTPGTVLSESKTFDGSVVWGTRAATSYLTLDGTPDGGVVWETKVHAGTQMRNRCEVSDCFIFNFTNAGIHIQAEASYAPPRNCNTWYLSKLLISFCGLGVAIAGGDANAGYSEGLSMLPVGWTWTNGEIPGYGGVGIFDHSFLGNVHVGAHVEASTGAGYIADGDEANTTFVGCYSETATPNIIQAPSIIVGGAHAAGFSSDSDGTRIVSGDMHRIIDQDQVTQLKPFTQMLFDVLPPVSVFVWRTSDEPPAMNFGWRYENFTSLPGWWALGYGQHTANNFIGISGLKSAVGMGNDERTKVGPNWRDFRGHFRGLNPFFNSDYYFGCAVNEDTDIAVRGAHFYPGDRFEMPGIPVPGGYVGKIVLTEGFRGRPWRGQQQASIGDPVFGNFPDTVEPSEPNGFVYRCINAGITGITEPGTDSNPPWPTIIGNTVNDGNVIWKCFSKQLPEYADYGLIVDRGIATTTDGSITLLDSYPLPDNETTSVDVTVTAFHSGSVASQADGAMFVLRGAWFRAGGGNVIQVKAPIVLDSNPNVIGAAWTAQLVPNGINIEVQVKGDLNKTIKWKCIRQGT